VAPRRLSPSALAAYVTCPRKLWFSHIAREQRREEVSAPLIIGNAVHAALDRFFGLPDRFRDLERLHVCLRAVWRRHAPLGTFATSDDEAEVGKAALALLDRFYGSFDSRAVPLSRERWLSTRLGNGVEVFTRADRIDESKGGIDIVDYKTGRHQLDSADLPREPAVQALAVAGSVEYRRPVRRVRYLYIASGEEARWEPEDEDIDAARERLVKATNEIIADREFEPLPGEHCRFCAFVHLCPAAGRVDLDDLEVPDDLGF
jgi:RecB family exonuclease